MKKLLTLAVAAALVAACNNTGKTASTGAGVDSLAQDSTLGDSVRYEGVIPAADGPGIKYNVAIASNDSTVGYSLTQTYLEAKDGQSTFASTGTVENIKKDGDGKEVQAYRLVGKTKEDDTYLLIVNDSTVRVVNADLKLESQTPEKYDLKLK